jgi:hypothetical protein
MIFNQLYQQQKDGVDLELVTKIIKVGDTSGFECDPNPSITSEGHGFTKHLVFRSQIMNIRRMVQTSLL